MSDEPETRPSEAETERPTEPEAEHGAADAPPEAAPEARRDELRRELGTRLKDARERRGLSIDEASSRLRIRKDYLRALEDADWSHLPEEVYAIGFLRQYARFLGEDVDGAVAELKSGDYRLTKPFTMPDPPIAPNRGWAIAAGLAFVLLLILFNTVGDDEPPAPPGEPLTATQPSVTTPPPAPQQAPSPSGAEPTKGEPATQSTATPPATSAAPAATAAAPSARPASSAKTTLQPSPAPSTRSTPPAATIHHYRLMAVGDKAWLQVHDHAGTLLREVLLRPGQSIRLDSDAPYLTVTCGNAAALQIEVDGETFAAAGTLGAPGKVLHNFRVSPSATVEGGASGRATP